MSKDNKIKTCVECEKLNLKIAELALLVDRVEDEKLDLENQLKRALADYHNLSNDNEKREKIKFFQLKRTLSQEIVPSLDALSMAIKSSEELIVDEKTKSWLDGLLPVFEGISRSLETIGLKQYIPLKGDAFDSNIHEALAIVDGEEKGKIVDTIQPGYVLDDNVIRPARVVVSK